MNERAKSIIAEIQLALDNNTESNYGYKVSHARLDDKSWKIVQELTDDNKRFTKNCKNIISQTNTDALQIAIFKNVNTGKERRLTPVNTYTIKLTDLYMPLIDEDGIESEENNSQKVMNRSQQHQYIASPYELEQVKEEATKEATERITMDFQSQLNGLMQQTAQKDFDNEIRFLKQEHRHELEKHVTRIAALQKELEGTEKLLSEAQKLVDTYEEQLGEAQSESNKLQTTGLALVAAKVAGLEKNEILGLAGAVLGGGGAEALAAGSGEDTAAEPSPSRTNLSPEQAQRNADMGKIYQWMSQLSGEDFAKFAQVVLAIDQLPSLLDSYLDVIQDMISPNPEQHDESETE